MVNANMSDYLAPVNADVPALDAIFLPWFALLTDKKLRRGAHRSIQALEKDIRDWITNWNDNPKPFTWTKTADEILERLASHIQRIPGAGH